MSISQRVEALIQQFSPLTDWEDKYRFIIEMVKALPPMPEELKLESNKVKGCQSQVWFSPELKGQHIIFHADSDASIVKGLVAILMSVYNDATPDEILAMKPVFIDTLGLRQHLSMSRANGLNAMLKQISLYALAFKHKLSLNL